jgi:2-octaprenyl-6-methoxyphenol hydroxylase
MKMDNFDIIIAGGGVPGLALANILAPVGFRIALFDPAPFTALKDTKIDSRTAALMQGSINILKATGAWDDCAALGSELSVMRIIDENTPHKDRMKIDFYASELDLPAFAINMPNVFLRAALYDKAKTHKNIKLFEGVTLDEVTYEPQFVLCNASNGKTFKTPLIIGADGRNSTIRKSASISYREHDFKQSAITCLIEHSNSHSNISTEIHRPVGPFTMVPLPGSSGKYNKMSSVVWVDHDAVTKEMVSLPDALFTQELQKQSRDLLGNISVISKPHAWPLKGLVADRLTAHRAIIIAEAAHVIHPLGAQGLNLSLRDVGALAEILTDAARAGADIGSKVILEQYEKRRFADVQGRVLGTENFVKLVANNNPVIHKMRRAGLKTVSSFSPLRFLAMTQGLAPQDPQSRLLKGQAL